MRTSPDSLTKHKKMLGAISVFFFSQGCRNGLCRHADFFAGVSFDVDRVGEAYALVDSLHGIAADNGFSTAKFNSKVRIHAALSKLQSMSSQAMLAVCPVALANSQSPPFKKFKHSHKVRPQSPEAFPP